MTDCFKCYFLAGCPNWEKGTCPNKATQISSKLLVRKCIISEYSRVHASNGDIEPLMRRIAKFNKTHKQKIYYRANEYFYQKYPKGD